MEGQSSRMGTSEGDSSTLPLHLQPYGQYHGRDVAHMLNGTLIFDSERGSNSYSDRHHVSKRTNMSYKTNGAKATYREPIASLHHQTISQNYLSPPLIPKLNRRKSSENLSRRHSGYKAVLGTHQQLYMGMLGLVIFSSFTMYFSIHVLNEQSSEISISNGKRGGSNRHMRSHRPWMVVWNTSDSNYLPQPQSENPTFTFHLPQASTAKSSTRLSVESSVADAFELSTTNTTYIEDESTAATNTSKCLPMAEWMKASFPNCNSIHEIDMKSSVSSFRINDNEGDLKFLGQGWFRSTWKYRDDTYQPYHNIDDPLPPTAVVLKTLRIEREFLDEYFDLHRRDAVAMERLTFSPYVVNIYGYCGQSAVNELAEGIVGGTITNLEQLNRRLRGKEEDHQALFLKLQLATKVALGLAHVHNVHVSESGGGRSASIQSLLYEHTDPKSSHSTTGFGMSIPTMAHYDINPRNIAVMRDGSPKLNDFNLAEFLTYNPQTMKPCGFRSRLDTPWWRAPEEMNTNHTTFVDEKVDIYAFGEVLFHILTTHGPRGKMKDFRADEVRALVRQGVRPTMFEPFASGGQNGSLKKNRIVQAFFKAMDLCFELDPSKRGTAIQVARVLHKALKKEEEERRNQKEYHQ